MKRLFTIFSICLTTVAYSQTDADVKYFYSITNDNDSTIKYYLSLLNNFDFTDWDRNFICEKVAERVGDYYKSQKDYLKALAYYDSAGKKYRSHWETCGYGHDIVFIPRQHKLAECYVGLRKPKEALAILTPFIFDSFRPGYFDSTITSYYLTLVRSLYSSKQIQNALKLSVEEIKYNADYCWSPDSASKSIIINCTFGVFDSKLELGGALFGNDHKIPFYWTKEGMITRFKNLEIYKKLLN